MRSTTENILHALDDDEGDDDDGDDDDNTVWKGNWIDHILPVFSDDEEEGNSEDEGDDDGSLQHLLA